MTTTDAPPRPRFRPAEAARFVWTQLTSMKTALGLLLTLALAAIPGSFLPQRPNTPAAVTAFLADNPTVGRVYDALGLFDVFTSPWFSAIYLLLFVSLIGCIVPRIAVYARALRAPVVAAPQRPSRLPVHAVVPVAEADDTLDTAEAWLRARRFRVRREAEAVSAERGYLRELGNLVFHVSLLFLLVGVAWTNLYGFKGSAIVVEGQGFSNTLTQYDDVTAGAAFRPAVLEPFTVALETFHVRFETGPVQHGAAREFRADVTTSTASGSTRRTLEVNQPLLFGGTYVHLIAHGYAPVVTVRDASGQVAFSGPVVFLPQDGNFTSVGVIKAPDARPQRLAFEGFFLPSGRIGPMGPESFFPDAFNPELFLNAWVGPPAVESGRPQNVYSLDKTGLEQVKDPSGDPVRMELTPGETFQLPGGAGAITFDGYRRWIKLQISDQPGLWLSGIALAVGVVGVSLSLFIRPRRLWVRVRETPDGLVAEVAGLDRADTRTGLREQVDGLSTALPSATKEAP